MKTKELLTVEFRYNDYTPHNEFETGYKTKTITLGVFDTLEEAIAEGNKALEILSKSVKIKERFKLRGLFGRPDRLVTNNQMWIFAKIEQLRFNDLSETVTEVFAALKRYKDYKESEQD